MSASDPREGPPSPTPAELRAGLQRLTRQQQREWHIGARLRNYFLTGLVIVGPVTITLYFAWWFINVTDAWIKPFVPKAYLPDTYLPFEVPGFGLIVGIVALTLLGALAANLLGRTLISFGEQMVGGMPIVRNIYRALKQIFESVVEATGPGQVFQKVGLIEFPSKGLWSIVFVTGETTGVVGAAQPGGEADLLTVFMPTGIVPPTGFVCFLPRRNVTLPDMNVDDAAQLIIPAGTVPPDSHPNLRALAHEPTRDHAPRADVPPPPSCQNAPPPAPPPCAFPLPRGPRTHPPRPGTPHRIPNQTRKRPEPACALLPCRPAAPLRHSRSHEVPTPVRHARARFAAPPDPHDGLRAVPSFRGSRDRGFPGDPIPSGHRHGPGRRRAAGGRLRPSGLGGPLQAPARGVPRDRRSAQRQGMADRGDAGLPRAAVSPPHGARPRVGARPVPFGHLPPACAPRALPRPSVPPAPSHSSPPGPRFRRAHARPPHHSPPLGFARATGDLPPVSDTHLTLPTTPRVTP